MAAISYGSRNAAPRPPVRVRGKKSASDGADVTKCFHTADVFVRSVDSSNIERLIFLFGQIILVHHKTFKN